MWKRIIYALKSGDETDLPKLPVPFSQFFLSREKILCRYWPQKPVPIEQGRDKTLALARKKYYWPTLRIDVEAHVAQCIECAKHKGVIKEAAPILPWDVVSIDLLQLPQSHYYDSRYLLVYIDQFSRYLVLAPLHYKSAKKYRSCAINSLNLHFHSPTGTTQRQWHCVS